MLTLSLKTAEEEILKVVRYTNKLLRLEEEIDENSCPGNMKGISSQILVTIISQLSNSLYVEIPADCYLFYDKKNKKQLSITEAARKLIKEGNNYE